MASILVRCKRYLTFMTPKLNVKGKWCYRWNRCRKIIVK